MTNTKYTTKGQPAKLQVCDECDELRKLTTVIDEHIAGAFCKDCLTKLQ